MFDGIGDLDMMSCKEALGGSTENLQEVRIDMRPTAAGFIHLASSNL